MNQNEEMDSKAGNEMLEQMQKLAKMWRKKLQEPAVKLMVKNGNMKISPLVQQLLNAFPSE